MLKPSRDKNEGTYRSGKGVEVLRACYVTPDLSYEWEGEREEDVRR